MGSFDLRRYGLLGLNGCGKSTLLTAIGHRELPIPEHMDIHHLTREIEASDMSALQAVICCDEERIKLEKEAEILSAQVGSSALSSLLFYFTCVCRMLSYNFYLC
jgi:ATPase subunit of ABC transporter with duplicated ATPase domains